MGVTDVIPTGAAELEEMLADPKQMKALFANGQPTAKFGEFIKSYAAAQMDEKTEIAAQVRDETQKVLAEFMKTQRKDTPSGFNPLDQQGRKRVLGGGKGVFYNKRAPGAKIDEANLFGGDYTKMLQAITPKAMSGEMGLAEQVMNDLGSLKRIQNSFGTIVPADGGFLVPESLRSDLMQATVAESLVRPLATVIPMETPRVGIPYVENTSEVGGTFAGLTFYWTEEGAALTETQGKFGQTVLDANKLTGYVEAPSELVADASAFGAFLDQALPRGMALAEDYAFLNGNGVGKPRGLLNNNATVTAAATAGQGTGTIIWENILAMYARMLPSSLTKAVWFADIQTFPQLATMALNVGTGGAPVWLPDGTGTPRLTLLGRPIYFTGAVPQLGTTGDIAFVDPAYYLIGDRQTWQMSASEHYRFGNDKIAYRIIERVDGRPWIQSAITPANSGATLSPFVQLSSTRT
jgi:HK97 family phage major capsid protein